MRSFDFSGFIKNLRMRKVDISSYIKNRQRTMGVSPWVNALKVAKSWSKVSLRPFLRFRGSRPGLFYDLSTGEFCPLRIPLDKLGAAVSPADKS